MVRTNDGFEISEADLKMRGPGDIMGTKQSGLLDLKLADLAKDGQIVTLAREKARELFPSNEFIEGDANVAMSFQGSQFDTITIMYFTMIVLSQAIFRKLILKLLQKLNLF